MPEVTYISARRAYRSRKRFPDGTWKQANSKEIAAVVTEVFIVEVLQIKIEDIPKIVRGPTFREHRLGGMLAAIFKNSAWAAIDNLYPGRFKRWEFPIKKWTPQLIKDATHWLVEEKLGINEAELDQLPEKLEKHHFVEYNLNHMLTHPMFQDRIRKVLEYVYPGRFKRWEFPMSKWNKKIAGEATRWLVEEKLKIPLDKVPKKVNGPVLSKHLKGMLRIFDYVVWKAIDNAYPGRFTRWEFHMKKWDLKAAAEATRWMVEERLKIPLDKVPKQVSTLTFGDNRLSGMLTTLFKGRGAVWQTMENAYPGRFSIEQFRIKDSSEFAHFTEFCRANYLEALKCMRGGGFNLFFKRFRIRLKPLARTLDIGLDKLAEEVVVWVCVRRLSQKKVPPKRASINAELRPYAVPEFIMPYVFEDYIPSKRKP